MPHVKHIRRTAFLCAFVFSAISLFAAEHDQAPGDCVTLVPDCGSALGVMAPPASVTLPCPAQGPGSGAGRGWPLFLDPPGAGFPYTPTLFDADNDGADEIFLTGGYTFGLGGDGSFMPGWPVKDMDYMGYATNGNKPGPSAADMDGDGNNEILWTERDWWAGSAYMWCFNGKYVDGTDMPGLPQAAPDQSSNALDTPFVLGDTDGDGNLEAWGAHTLGNNFTHYRVSAFDTLGNKLFTTDINSSEDIVCLYFGDLDGDGTSEMFAVSWLAPTYKLYVFEPDGTVRAGYPITLHTIPSSGYEMFGVPVPADLDGDGDLEILNGYNYGSASHAVCLHHDGTPCTGFPIQIATSSQLFYIGLGDVTGDGDPELLAFDNHLGGSYRAFAIDMSTGTLLAGWPYGIASWPKGFPTVVDADNDGVQDICFATDSGELFAVTGGGMLIAGYPKTMSSASISGVAAGDIDGDGLFELVAATSDGWVYAWDTDTPALPGRADWPMRGVNARNTGVFVGSSAADTLTADTDVLPGNTGGTVNFSLAAGSDNANRRYLLAGSRSGTQPGTLLPGGLATIPLNRDQITDFILGRLNSPPFTDFYGTLDPQGNAAAQLNAPPVPSMIGMTLHFAYALASPWDFASNPVEVEIVP